MYLGPISIQCIQHQPPVFRGLAAIGKIIGDLAKIDGNTCPVWSPGKVAKGQIRFCDSGTRKPGSIKFGMKIYYFIRLIYWNKTFRLSLLIRLHLLYFTYIRVKSFAQILYIIILEYEYGIAFWFYILVFPKLNEI